MYMYSIILLVHVERTEMVQCMRAGNDFRINFDLGIRYTACHIQTSCL